MSPKKKQSPLDEVLNVRLSSRQLDRFSAVAEDEGLPVSTWVRRVAILAAKKEDRFGGDDR